MPLTPAQIKDKLTNALDDEKNVIDEKAVEEVIALLETSTITKEILEQTRLGRDINLVRKISKNPAIAKRAKNLVKAWKKLIVVPVNGQHQIQRISPHLSPATSRCSTPVKCLPSPALLNVRQQPAKTLVSRSPGVQPISRVGQQPLPPSKLAQDMSTRYVPGTKSPKSVSVVQVLRHASITQNEESNISWPRTPPSNLSESSQDRLIGDRENQESSSAGIKAGSEKRNFDFDSQSVHSTETTSKSANRAPDQRDVSKTNVANRKRTRSNHIDDSNDSFPDTPLSKQPRLVSSSPSLSTLNRSDVINGAVVKRGNIKSPGLNARDCLIHDSKATVTSSSRFNHQDIVEATVLPNHIHPKNAFSRQASVDSRLSVHSSDSRGFREKLGKVKTTEQIIEDMQRKSATTVGTSVIAQIRTNQIRKESDSQKNVLPSGKKRRGRKKKQERELPDTESVSDGRRLAQAKMENIERFLRTSVLTPEDVYEHSLHNLRQESLDEQPLPLGGCSSAFSQPAYDSGFHTYSSRQDKPDSGPSASPPETRDLLEGLCNMSSSAAVNGDTSESLSEEQILARLPHIDYDSIDWSLHDYPAPQIMSVTDDLVCRLHKENMEGVNGTFDRDGQFKKWQEMLTVDSSYDEPLFILPYVIPND